MVAAAKPANVTPTAASLIEGDAGATGAQVRLHAYELRLVRGSILNGSSWRRGDSPLCFCLSRSPCQVLGLLCPQTGFQPTHELELGVLECQIYLEFHGQLQEELPLGYFWFLLGVSHVINS